MTRDPARVLENVYASWRLQDVAAVLDLCTAKICYVVHKPPEIVGVGGCMLGLAEVRSYLEAVCRTWEFLEIVPGTFHIQGDEIRELMRFKTRLRGTADELEGSKRHIWQFRNGRVCQFQEFQDAQSIRAFLGMFAPADLRPSRPAIAPPPAIVMPAGLPQTDRRPR